MLLFVRHGEIQTNVDGIFTGPEMPAPLTANGRAQATAAGQYLINKKVKVDNMVVSPLPRTVETAHLIAKEINFALDRIQLDEKLREYDMGSLSGTKLSDTPPSERVKAPGAEDPEAFAARVKEGLKAAAKLPGCTLVVSHNGVGRVLLTMASNHHPRHFYELDSLPNAAPQDITGMVDSLSA